MVLPGACNAAAAAGMAALQIFYNSATGLWKTTNWWNSANALETTIDYSMATNTRDYRHLIANTYEKQKATKFLNEWYDDEGWWALTWIKAYDLTGEKRYLNTAKFIFNDMKKGWDSTCGGGVWWKKDRQYKNAITNELFLTVAVRLHQRTVNDYRKGSYLDWAKRSWNWFKQSGMINRDQLVNDGLNNRCRNNGKPTWTYNQGVIVGGLVDLYQSTKNRAYLDQANAIAKSAMRNLTTKGVLREKCEPNCGEDGAHFKGIFIRNLSYLYQVTREPAYKSFILRNADAVWSRRTATNQFGLGWDTTFDRADAARQSSAIDVLNAALPLSRPIKAYPVKRATLYNLSINNKQKSHVVGWNRDGQWLDFQVNAACSGRYDLSLRYTAAAGDASRYIFVNGRSRVNDQLFPATDSWTDWNTITIPNVALNAGKNTLAILFNSRKGSRNWLNLAEVSIE